MTPDGMIVTASRFAPDETVERVVAAVTARGMAVMARIDHASAAAGVGLVLRPTQVLMFGNPKAGTVLMQAAPTAGIDLPLKILVWQDDQGATWIGYNDPHWIARRHGATIAADPVISAMGTALASVAREAGAESD